MMLMGRKSLGVSFGNRSLQVAEICAAGKGYRILRSAEFSFGEGDSLQTPASLGKKLAQFLKQNNFSARQAVFGMPAQWLLLKEMALPPAAPEMLAGMLRIQAERNFSMEPAALASDYIVAQTPGAQPDKQGTGTAVVLAATMREKIEQLCALAQAAGLKPQAITATSLVLAAAVSNPNVLYFGINGAELAALGLNGLPRLRSLAPFPDGSNTAQLAGELRRALKLSPQDNSVRELTVWDDLGLANGLVEKLADELKMPLSRGKGFKVSGWNGTPQALAEQKRAAGSSALALCQFQPALLRLDFLHSRLAVAPPSRLSPKILWGAAVAAALLIAGGFLLFDWQQSMNKAARLKKQLDEMKADVEEAKSFLARAKTSGAWYNRRPNYLECLRALVQRFPEDGSVWTSSLSLREDMRGILTGSAADENSVLDFVDKLKKPGTGPKGRPAFAEIKIDHTRSTDLKNSEISFAVSFIYLGGE